jgi:hypothetical protein
LQQFGLPAHVLEALGIAHTGDLQQLLQVLEALLDTYQLEPLLSTDVGHREHKISSRTA